MFPWNTSSWWAFGHGENESLQGVDLFATPRIARLLCSNVADVIEKMAGERASCLCSCDTKAAGRGFDPLKVKDAP